MKFRALRITVLALCMAVFSIAVAAEQLYPAEETNRISRSESLEEKLPETIEKELPIEPPAEFQTEIRKLPVDTRVKRLLKEIYHEVRYRPFVAENQHAEAIYGAIVEISERHGLPVLTSHVRELSGNQSRDFRSSPWRAELELAAVPVLAAIYLSEGAVPPLSIQEENGRTYDPEEFHFLRRHLSENEMLYKLESFAPDVQEYNTLVEILGRTRYAHQENPIELPEKGLFKKDYCGPEVVALMKRFELTAAMYDQSNNIEDWPCYSTALMDKVKEFQRRRGLKDDGVIGPLTASLLNLGASEKERIIAVNLERWRWVSSVPAEKQLRVNVPEYKVHLIKNNAVDDSIRVITGKEYQPTAFFSDEVTQIVINPWWNIPYSITSKEIVPDMKDDPVYLQKQGYRAYREGTEVTPDISELAAGRQQLRQPPGAGNALGRIKFLFPNNYSIYLHDTPTESLFDKSQRALSHGCVRVEKPVDLAEWLLDDPEWSAEAVGQAIDSGKTRTLQVKPPIPIVIGYWTVVTREDGSVDFLFDIYKKDEELASALFTNGGSSSTPEDEASL